MPYDSETGEWIEEEPSGSAPPRTNSEWAEYRQEQKKARDAEREAQEAKRELAFYKAGIDPTKDPKLGLFMKAYDGKPEPDAIRAAAAEYGFDLGGGAPEPPADPAAQAQADAQAQANADALAAGQRIAQANAGATPPPVDPSTIITDAFNKGGESALMEALAEQGIPIAIEGIIQE